MPSSPEFNPHSLDANLACIFEKLDAIQSTCVEIKAEAKKTNGRVTALERFRDILTTRVATIATGTGVLGGGLVWLAKILFDV